MAGYIDYPRIDGNSNVVKSGIRRFYSLRLLVRDAFFTSIILSLLAQYIHREISLAGIVLPLSIGFGYALGFAINDYFDKDIDVLDPNKSTGNYFVNNSIGIGFFVLGLTFIFLLYSFSLFGIEGLSVILLSVFAFMSYSAKPIRFKSRPGMDLISHGLFNETYPYLITMFLLKFNWGIIDYLILVILFMNSIVNQIGQQLRDYHIDTQIETNFTIKYGKERSSAVFKLINLLIATISFLAMILGFVDIFLIPLIIIVLPIFIDRSLKYNQTRSSKIYKVTIFLFFMYWIIVFLLQFMN